MTRVLVSMIATLLVSSVASGFAVLLGLPALPVTPGAVIVAYAALATPPVEAAVTATLTGFIVDALGGAPIGVSSFSLVVTLLLSRLGVSVVQTTRGGPALVFVGAFAAVQALVALLLLGLAGDRAIGPDLIAVVLVAGADALLAAVLFPLLRGVLVRLHVEDRGATLRERLRARQG